MLTATCSQPTDPIPTLFAPRVVRVEKSGPYPWEVQCDIDPWYCSTGTKTKREATERASAPSWVRFAADVAERQGLTRVAPTPSKVCFTGPRDLYYPDDPAPWMHSGRGDAAYCGRPVCFLGDARALATFRLAWSPDRMREAVDPDRRWARDWTTWVEASVQAKADLTTGSLTPAEEAALGATPETAAWLRLDEFAQKCLRDGVFSPTGHDLRAFYTPGSFAHNHTCWANGSPGPHPTATNPADLGQRFYYSPEALDLLPPLGEVRRLAGGLVLTDEGTCAT